jgi:thiol-disulfide isomerase/thioredoxin
MARPAATLSRRFGVIAAMALAAVSVLLASCGGAPAQQRKAWPSVVVSDANGTSTGSDTVLLPGRPAVIAVWAVWCRPCREELPRLDALSRENPGVRVAAVNLGDEPAAVTDYTTSMSLGLPVFIDSDGRLTEALGVSSVPATVFVGADGRIVDVHLGALSPADLDAGVRRLLAG